LSEVNIVRSIAKTVDDALERLGLGKPVTALLDLLYDISPKSILTEKLGIPAPGDLAEQAKQQIRTAFRAGTLPKPEQLLPKLR